MCVGRELGAEDVSHDSLAVDHVGDAARDDAKRFGDAERLAERAVGVARQEEGQPIAAGEAFVLLARIAADADDGGARLDELFE